MVNWKDIMRGLRRGDPIWRFFAILGKKIGKESFTLYHKCRALELSHLALADDFFVMCGAGEQSLAINKFALDEF